MSRPTSAHQTKRPILPPAVDELARYFSGELEAAMGHRSSMGPQVDALALGFHVVSPVESEPSPAALQAARAMRRVERSLDRLSRTHRIILAAFHTPLPPDAPWGLRRALGEYAAVAVAIGELDLSFPGLGHRSVDGELARLRRIVTCASRKSPWRRGARVALEHVRSKSVAAVRDAQEAYEAAHRDVRIALSRCRRARPLEVCS